MRIQCDSCAKSVASVICCADEAALCADCDSRIHSANKLVSKHQRVPFLPDPDSPPRCDICQVCLLFLSVMNLACTLLSLSLSLSLSLLLLFCKSLLNQSIHPLQLTPVLEPKRTRFADSSFCRPAEEQEERKKE
jgi:hypothetical protein